MIGVRDSEVDEFPIVKWERVTCAKCGERIWIPGATRADGPHQCLNHNDGPWADLLKLIVDKF